MLNDNDEWTILCPNCPHETRTTIALMKNLDSFTCPDCGTGYRFERTSFHSLLDHLRMSVWFRMREEALLIPLAQGCGNPALAAKSRPRSMKS